MPELELDMDKVFPMQAAVANAADFVDAIA